MVHVVASAVLAGIDHAYTPPREPSLNEAEKVCLTRWDDASISDQHDWEFYCDSVSGRGSMSYWIHYNYIIDTVSRNAVIRRSGKYQGSALRVGQ